MSQLFIRQLELINRLQIAIQALDEISKDKYELTPWQVTESRAAVIAIKALKEIGNAPNDAPCDCKDPNCKLKHVETNS